jgi:hypothetical protein
LLSWQLGRVPIEIAARSGRREDVEVLFPVTSRIPSVRDWSVDGIMNHVKSVRPAKVQFRTTLLHLFKWLTVQLCMLAVSFFFSDGDLPNVIFLDSLLQFENST